MSELSFLDTGKRAMFKITTNMETIKCKFCGSEDVVRFGHYKGIQRYFCKNCERKFTALDTLPKMKTPIDKVAAAVSMYYEGLSLSEIQRILKQVYSLEVSDFAVYNWIDRFTKNAIEITRYYRPNTGYVWSVDETAINISGKQYWLLNVIDIKTRFLLASYLSRYRRVEDVQSTLTQAYNCAGKLPKVIMSDRLQAYQDAIPLTFGSNKVKHLQVKKFASRPNNNIIERLHGTIKGRTKVMRDLKRADVNTVLSGFAIHYNYFRPHETLSKEKSTTPAEKAQTQFPYGNWESFIRHSQEAGQNVPSHYTEVAALPKIELTARQKQLVYARRHRRKKIAEKRQAKSTIRMVR
jgi:transposase-like protein